MRARELAFHLRTVRLTHDMVELRALAQQVVQSYVISDAADTLLWAIAEKCVRMEQLN